MVITGEGVIRKDLSGSGEVGVERDFFDRSRVARKTD